MEVKKQAGLLIKEEYYEDILPYIQDPNITDIDYDGKTTWITDINNECWDAGIHLSRKFLERFCGQVSNAVSEPFNQGNPVLEAETETLRISIGHEEVAKTGRTISIRKTSDSVRFTAKEAVQSGYCSPELFQFLVNATLAGMRFVVCGEVASGKTELCKVLSSYIPKPECVFTIEDNLEWHYDKINPGANGIALKVNERFSYSDAIIFALRHHAKRIMLSEARGGEVKELMTAWSTGHSGFSTIHTDSVFNIADRMFQMMPSPRSAERMINDVYRYVDIGLLVRIKEKDGKKYRLIDEACFFDRKDRENKEILFVRDGELISRELPERLIRKFDRAKIRDPWYCEQIERELKESAPEVPE